MEILSFCIEKIKANHPAYIIDKTFHNDINKVKALTLLKTFIKNYNDPHFGLLLNNTKSLKNDKNNENNKSIMKSSSEYEFIHIPSFDNARFNKQHILEWCRKQRNITSNKPLIIDIRYNSGGNSYNAELVIKALYGLKMYKWVNYQINKNVKILWRNSIDNRSRIKNDYGWINLYQNMKKNPNDIYIQNLEFIDINEEPKSILKHRQIFVFIDNSNISAALDFLDMIKIINHAKLVGNKKTGFDTNYMDINRFNLPQNMGLLWIPMKYYDGRIRKSGDYYKPDISITNFLHQFPSFNQPEKKFV